MAHFAEIDNNNIVQRILVVSNSNASNEAAGIAFCKALLGSDTNWVQTSYNDNIRHRFAAIGMKYDATNDVFYKQQPYASWTLNTSTWEWEPPVPEPDDAGFDDEDNPTQLGQYTWDEDTRALTNRTVL